jgi:hypothetical protein
MAITFCQAGRQLASQPLPQSHKQQSRRRYAANGFAFVPLRAVFSDSIRRAIEPAVK